MCVGVPCKVLAVDTAGGPLPMATISLAGAEQQVCTAYLPELAVGDYVLVQNGFAMSVLSEAEALESIAAWQSLGVLGADGTAAESAAAVFPLLGHDPAVAGMPAASAKESR